MRSLELNINPDWRKYMGRRNRPDFRSVSEQVWARDKYVCQFCGFQAMEHQEIINLDGNYGRNVLSNLATACCFCAQCLFIDAVGKIGYGGGKLIYLPEMKQIELNAFCHVLFCSMINDTAYHDTAQDIYRVLKFRSQPIEDKFGSGSSEPSFFSQMVIESGDNWPNLAKTLLVNFRLLPNYTKFKKQLEAWAASAAKKLHSDE